MYRQRNFHFIVLTILAGIVALSFGAYALAANTTAANGLNVQPPAAECIGIVKPNGDVVRNGQGEKVCLPPEVMASPPPFNSQAARQSSGVITTKDGGASASGAFQSAYEKYLNGDLNQALNGK